MKVLLLYGDGTQAIPVVKELRKAGHVVDAVGESPYGYGSNSRYLNKFYLFEDVEDVGGSLGNGTVIEGQVY